MYADVSKANQTSQDIIKKLTGGIGVQNYLIKEQREANRRAAEARVASMGPGVRTLNSTRLKELSDEAERARNQTIAKPKTKKTIKDYQAEERYRDAQDAKRKAEEEALAKIEKERQDKENRRLAKIEQLKKSFEETKTQLQNDVTAYRERRIDDIKNNELRSRAQTERNLGFEGDNKKGLSYYQLAEETYKNALRQQKEHDMLMLIPAVMQMGISEIPKVGDAVSSVVDAALNVTNAAKDTSADARRNAILKAGPPVRPDVLEGFTGEFPEPDWNDLAEKEGYGKPKNIKLYEKVKKEIQKKNPKHSLFRSAAIVKEYKNRGGEYTGDKTESGLDKWFGQKWLSVNDYYHDKKEVPCGASDTENKFGEYPLCRPSKIVKELSDSQIKKMIKEKIDKNPLHTEDVLKTDKYNVGSGHGSLHAVIIDKRVPLEEAKKEAAEIIQNPNKKFFRETGKSYRFRNISKQKFEPKSFRTKVVSPTLSLVYGNLA